MNRRLFLKGALTLVLAQNVVSQRAQALDASRCALTLNEVDALLRIHNQAVHCPEFAPEPERLLVTTTE